MKKFILAAVFAAVASTALAQTVTEKTGVNSALGVAPKTADFVKEAASSDMFEIESSKLAMQRSDDATKAFAQQMMTDHQKTSEELKGLVTSGKVKAKIPAAMAAPYKKMLTKLSGLQGADFTKQYHSDQEKVHKDAVDLFQRYGDKGDNAQLKAWAATTRPALEHHLQMAKDLNK